MPANAEADAKNSRNASPPRPRRPPFSTLLAGGLRPYAVVQDVSPLLPFYDDNADLLVAGAKPARTDERLDPLRRQKAQARHLRQEHKLRQGATQPKHLIFFPVTLDRVLYRRALYDSGCEKSVISRAAYDYLRGKARMAPVERKIDTVELSAWFGGKSNTDTEIGVLMKFGNRRRIVWFLLVECFDYELVIGNDIFRGVFKAGIAPGDQQCIVWTDGSYVPYKTIDDRLPDKVKPDPARDLRLPVHVARDQKIGARGVTAVEVYVPPYEHVAASKEDKINWSSGLIEPIKKFNRDGLQMRTHLSRPLMLMSLAVANVTARPVTIKAGDICAYFTPASEVIESAETARWAEYIPYAVAAGYAKILPPGKDDTPRGMPTPADANVPTSPPPAAPAGVTNNHAAPSSAPPVSTTSLAGSLTTSPAASNPSLNAAPAAPSPDQGRVLTDVPGKVDPGAEGVFFDERAEIPRNTPQVPVATVLGEDCPAEFRPRYEKEISERILVNDHAFAPELSKAQPMRIRLTDNRVVNITRHLPIDKAKAADDIVLEYARQRIVRESTSPFNAPVVLAKKPDGSWHFCIDYRALNAVTECDAYEFPLITDMLNALNGSRVFSMIDLSAGFHQIPIEEESRKYTAFSTLSGHWEFNRVPYGLTNSPPWMQRNISLALRGLEWKICVVWIDDIIIFSKSHEEHLQHLSQVLDALRTAGLQVRLKKCKFAVSKVKYLGHVVSGDGVAPLEDNIKDIRDCPEPTTVKELQRVLGLFNYYRRFVKDFSRLSRFLSDYLKGNPNGRTPVKLDDNARLAFNELKQKLIAAPVLAYPDFDKQFIVETDASQHHVGAILSQIGSDGKEHPVAYWSDILAPRASFWSAYKRELWALISACKHWRNYLQIRQEFTARFDQRALKWIFDVKDREPMLAGWIMQLEEYGIRLEYQPGEKHQHVDALTKGPINRNPYLHGGESHAPEAQALKPAEVVRLRSLRVRWPYENAREDMLCLRRPRIPGVYLPRSEVKIGSLALSFNLNEFSRLQREDPLLKPLFDYYEKNAAPSLSDDNDLRRWLEVRKEYIVDPKDRVLYHVMRRKNNDEVRRRRVVPQRMRQAVMHEYHATPQAGHFAFDKAYHRLSNDFYWPGMAAEFYNFCINCQECGAFNHKPNTISTRNLPGHLVNLPAVSRPLERVAMDIHGPYTEGLQVHARHHRSLLALCVARTPQVAVGQRDRRHLSQDLPAARHLALADPHGSRQWVRPDACATDHVRLGHQEEGHHGLSSAVQRHAGALQPDALGYVQQGPREPPRELAGLYPQPRVRLQRRATPFDQGGASHGHVRHPAGFAADRHARPQGQRPGLPVARGGPGGPPRPHGGGLGDRKDRRPQGQATPEVPVRQEARWLHQVQGQRQGVAVHAAPQPRPHAEGPEAFSAQPLGRAIHCHRGPRRRRQLQVEERPRQDDATVGPRPPAEAVRGQAHAGRHTGDVPVPGRLRTCQRDRVRLRGELRSLGTRRFRTRAGVDGRGLPTPHVGAHG